MKPFKRIKSLGLKNKSLIILVLVVLTAVSMFLENGTVFYLIIGASAIGCLLLIGMVVMEAFGENHETPPELEGENKELMDDGAKEEEM